MCAAVPVANAESGGGQPRDEAHALRRVVALCGHLSALASQATDVEAIAGLLHDSIGSKVVVLDRGLEILASSGADDPADIVAVLRQRSGASGLNTILAAAARSRRALSVPAMSPAEGWVVVAPISVGEGVAGYLITVSEQVHDLNENLRLMVIEHATMICGVVLGRDLVVAAAASRARRQLLEGLLLARNRDDNEIERWARHLGFDPARSYAVITLTVPEHERRSGLAAVEAALGQLATDAIVVSRADEVVAIAPVDGDTDVRTLADRCAERIARRRLGPVAVGIGNPCQTPAEIARSYAEARHALAASERMGGFGGVTAFGDLGIQRLFLRVPDIAYLRGFADEVVGKLLDGQSGGAEFLATLAVYFEENSSPQRAARRLNVHPNTVTYRIRRVEEITGLSLAVHRDRLMLAVAVEILAALRSRS
jgi:hypothetical protein